MTEQPTTAIPTHVTEVVRVEPHAGSFVRVTFGGGLERFRPLGPDDFVHILLPPPGRRELTIDTSFRWTTYEEMAEADRPVGAYYTVRAFRPELGELDCDVHLHEPSGPVSAWAPHAEPGDPAALWGPRTAWAPPAGTTNWLLLADETGIPALAAILERRPSSLAVQVFVEAADPDDLPAFPEDDRVQLTWLARDRCDAGTTELLARAVSDGAVTTSATTYAWGGAESRAMAAVRRHLRRQRGLAKDQVSMTPYWRHADHAADPVDDVD